MNFLHRGITGVERGARTAADAYRVWNSARFLVFRPRDRAKPTRTKTRMKSCFERGIGANRSAKWISYGRGAGIIDRTNFRSGKRSRSSRTSISDGFAPSYFVENGAVSSRLVSDNRIHGTILLDRLFNLRVHLSVCTVDHTRELRLTFPENRPPRNPTSVKTL